MNDSIQNMWKISATYQIYKKIKKQLNETIEAIGEIGICAYQVMKLILRGDINIKRLIYECYRFSVQSLPITLSIVGMVAVILSMQIAPEMVKQGGGGYVGMLVAVVMIREIGVIMTGFAIISMIGSSMSAEIATMRVTEQIDAIEVLHVNPLNYLFVPKVLAGLIMMPIIVIISTTFGILCAGLVSGYTADVSWLNFISSVWQGLFMKDINVCLIKSVVFGGTIALISSGCGYSAKGGAKGVGIATTKAVVWSFLAIVIIDYIFAVLFYS